MRVTAYFAPAFSYGGPPRSILGLCRGLQRAEVNVEVFTSLLVECWVRGYVGHHPGRKRLVPASGGRNLASATLLHGTSVLEGGLSVVEAMAAGVPVVVTHTCPWDEVETAECGFYVRQSAEVIADALLRLVRDSESAREMGERERALAGAKYSWEPIACVMAEQYWRAAVSTARAQGGP